jgi:hypothetical protein
MQIIGEPQHSLPHTILRDGPRTAGQHEAYGERDCGTGNRVAHVCLQIDRLNNLISKRAAVLPWRVLHISTFGI